MDIRKGLTSASSAEADSLCPGRHLAQRGIPEYETKDSEAGTLIHRAFAGEKVELPLAQRKTLRQAVKLETSMVNAFFGDPEEPMPPEQVFKLSHREERLWVTHRDVELHSAQLDAYWLTPAWDRALVEDLKGLYGNHADAEVNMQLRDEAAILWHNYGCTEIWVWINQPNVHWGFKDQKCVIYKAEELELAYNEMLKRVAASNNIESPRKPGVKQCQFCRAAGTAHCPESQAAILGASKVVFDAGSETAKRRGEWIGTLKALEKMAKKGLSEMKSAVKADPDFAEGWTYSGEGQTRSLTEVMTAGRTLMDAYRAKGFTSEMLLSCCSVSLPALEEWHCTFTGLPNRESKEQLMNLIGELITVKEKDGSLKAVK